MNVLVVAAHTDDEALGCGATIRRHVDAGDAVFALALTDGVGARDEAGGEEARRREAAAAASAEALGFSWLDNPGLPDNALDSVPLLEVVQHVEAAKRSLSPTLVYTHHGGDLNVDHRVAFQATLTAFRPQPGEACLELRCFEVPSATEWSNPALGPAFAPTLFVDAAPTWAAKLAALEAYAEELREAPHSRSLAGIGALSQRRGTQVGLARAEAFTVVRRIVR